MPLATLPGMRDRTVTICSGGKTFSFTGWKVGWVCATAGAGRRGQDREAVPHLREQRAVPVRDRGRACSFPTRTSPGSAARCATSATGCARGWPTRASTCSDRRARTSRPSTSARSARPTASRSAGRCRTGVAWSRSRASCSTTTCARARPLVRFACCKRTEVLDEACTRLKSLGPMIVAGVQHDIVWEQPEENFARLAPMIERAAADGARLVVLTEMYSTGFSMKTDRIAEPVDGPSAQFLVDQARANGVWVCASRARTCDDGDARRSTSSSLAAPDGSTQRYAKIHPFTYGREHEHYSAGDEVPHRRDRRHALLVLRLLRPALRRRVLGARAEQTDCYVLPANWPAARARALDGAAARPGDREPGVRRRRQPGRRRRPAALLAATR